MLAFRKNKKKKPETNIVLNRFALGERARSLGCDFATKIPDFCGARDSMLYKINRKDIYKFLSGAFFVTAGVSWYLSWYQIEVPLLGFTMTPEFVWFRVFLDFALFLISFYFGFVRK